MKKLNYKNKKKMENKVQINKKVNLFFIRKKFTKI